MVKGYKLTRGSISRIGKATRYVENLPAERLDAPGVGLIQPEPVWFRLVEDLKNDGVAVSAVFLRWSPNAGALVDDYDQPSTVTVVDKFKKFWGVNGERGAAIPVAVGSPGSQTVENQIQTNPGRMIYTGTTSAAWTRGGSQTVSTPIETTPRNVTVFDPNYIPTGTTLPAGTVRFYFNLETSRFELLDAPACPT